MQSNFFKKKKKINQNIFIKLALNKKKLVFKNGN